ncbi:MAG: hypothetical protein Q3W93_07555, partial [Eubacterium sp.]|nr:hypothetical protein [Eubacterium sp.]
IYEAVPFSAHSEIRRKHFSLGIQNCSTPFTRFRLIINIKSAGWKPPASTFLEYIKAFLKNFQFIPHRFCYLGHAAVISLIL